MENNNKLESIYVPAQSNKLLQKALDAVNANEEIKTLWEIVNTNATERLGWSDHGSIHVQIVANSSLRIARILHKNKVAMTMEKDYGISYKHAEIAILLASLFHDLGMSIHRKGHEGFSLILANALLHDVLSFLPVREKTIVTSETLHAIIGHSNEGSVQPYTLEAGIVRIADALDMTSGRSRVPFEKDNLTIHSLAETAIDKVAILEGSKKLVQIDISLNNSAGIFAVDELLRNKIKGSGLEEYVAVRAFIDREDEKKLIDEFTI